MAQFRKSADFYKAKRGFKMTSTHKDGHPKTMRLGFADREYDISYMDDGGRGMGPNGARCRIDGDVDKLHEPGQNRYFERAWSSHGYHEGNYPGTKDDIEREIYPEDFK